MLIRSVKGILTGLAFFGLIGGAHAAPYMMVASKNLPKDLNAKVEAAGGTVTALLPQIGVALIDSDAADFGARAAAVGLNGISRDVVVNWLPRESAASQIAFDENAVSPPFSGDDDFYFDLQWGHDAIDTPEAWETGVRGAGARVAILDSGIASTHPDIAPNLNLALSTSFVPGEDVDVGPGFFFNHGTHVAGLVAAADNAFGTIGVAPEAELVAVKVLSQVTGSGSFGGIIQGIVYAADIDADIINMSLGATIPRSCTFPVLDDEGNPTGELEHFPAFECAQLFVATGRATTYARAQGSLVVVSAGNEGRDMNHDADVKNIPTELPGVMSISATAPIGWALDPANTFLDNLASYSNFGQSGIDLAAPGGDFSLPGEDVCFGPVVIQRCWVMDMSFSTIPGGWSWAAGTSMAAPHASGVAALIVSKYGKMSPAQLEAKLRQSADDLGKPGKDAAYGNGRVNAYNAVK